MKKYSEIFLLVLIPLVALAVVVQLYMFIPVSDVIQMRYSVNSRDASFVTSIFSGFYAIGLLFWGAISKRIKKEHILATGLILLAISTLGASFTQNYRMLLLTRAVQGFFASSFPPLAIMWIIQKIPSRAVTGITLISYALVIAGSIGQFYGLKTVTISASLPMLLLMPIYLAGAFIIIIYNNKNEAPAIRKVQDNGEPYKFNKKVIKAYIAAPFILASFISFHFMLSSHYTEMAHLMGKLSLIETVCFTSSLTAVIFIKRFTAAKVCSACLFITGITASVSMLSLIYGYDYFLYSQALFSIALGLLAPAIMAFITKYANSNTFITSFYIFLLFCGAGLGSVLPLITGVYTVFIQSAFLIIASLLFLKNKD